MAQDPLLSKGPFAASTEGMLSVGASPLPNSPDMEGVDPEQLKQLLVIGLQTDALVQTEEAAAKLTQSSIQIAQNTADGQTGRVITNKSIDELYSGIAGATEKVIGYMPPGSVITSKTRDIRTEIDPSSKKVVIIQQTPKEPAITVNTPAAQTFRNEAENAASKEPKPVNIAVEMAKLKDLRGNELASAITTLQASVAAQHANIMKRLDDSAAIESGHAAAAAALKRTIEVDQISGPLAVYGTPSYQTVQAQQMLNSTLAAKENLLKSKALKDPELAALNAASQQLNKIDAKIALREAKDDDRAAVVTAQQVANVKTVYGDMPDHVARQYVLDRGAKDKNVAAIASITSDNIYQALVHPSVDIRKGALKILNEWDKANNPNDNRQISQSVEFLKTLGIEANPAAIWDYARKNGIVTQEEMSKYQKELQLGGTAAEKAQITATGSAALLEKIVERVTQGNMMNMATWKTDVATSGPLANIINKVSKSNGGKAPMSVVIAQFVADQTVTKADGTPLSFAEKQAILAAGIQGAFANDTKTMLFADTSALRNQMMNDVKNTAARAYIQYAINSGRLSTDANLRNEVHELRPGDQAPWNGIFGR